MMRPYKYFLKKLFYLSLPVLLLTGVYIYFDPFKVIFHYETYYKNGYPSYVTLDKDYVSTQTFINNSKSTGYDAFIFGNSRSIFYEVDNWKNYIPSKNCYHFDGSGETLLGLYRKVVFLHKNHIPIHNALIILDHETLSEIEERKGHLFLSHPVLSGRSWLSFQLEYFKTFLSPEFFLAFIDFKLSSKIKPYMRAKVLLDDRPIDYLLTYNEIKLSEFEKLINKNAPAYYNEKRMSVFYKRDTIQKFSPPIITDVQYKMLAEIANILKSDHTNFKIIINPLYDQLKLNRKDLETLRNIFGEKTVFDFSGINFITSDYHNYYENSHYRPHIANYIMKEIYK